METGRGVKKLEIVHILQSGTDAARGWFYVAFKNGNRENDGENVTLRRYFGFLLPSSEPNTFAAKRNPTDGKCDAGRGANRQFFILAKPEGPPVPPRGAPGGTRALLTTTRGIPASGSTARALAVEPARS